jgi:hypothetical protein
VGTVGVALLALLPRLVLVVVIALAITDGEFGLPAIAGATAAILLGPGLFRLADRGAGSQGGTPG